MTPTFIPELLARVDYSGCFDLLPKNSARINRESRAIMTGWKDIIAMKRSKFTESQIVFALKQAETGVAVAEVCRKLGISEATFYNWKKKYGGLGPDELRRLRQLEEENSRLKQIVADLSLDKQMLQDVLKKKL